MKLTTQRVFLALTVALVIYQAAVAIGVALFANESDRWFFVIVPAIGAVMVGAGVRVYGQSPMLSGILTALGVIPSIIMFWVVIPPIIALWVAVYALYSGFRRQRESSAGA